MDIIQTETQLNSEAVHLIFISSNNGNFIFLKQMLSQRKETSEIFISFNWTEYFSLQIGLSLQNKILQVCEQSQTEVAKMFLPLDWKQNK